MKVTILGTGGAFAPLNIGHSSFLIETNMGKKILYDCGSTVPYVLQNMQIKLSDIDVVIISHLHSDHTGGLEQLGFYNYFSGKRPTLIADREVARRLWENTLSGGMEIIGNKVMHLTDYFEYRSMDSSVYIDDITINFFQNLHVRNEFSPVYSFGVQVESESGKILAISGDACEVICGVVITTSDIIFHEVEDPKINSQLHTKKSDLEVFCRDYKSKIHTYHNDGYQIDEFAPALSKGQIFNL